MWAYWAVVRCWTLGTVTTSLQTSSDRTPWETIAKKNNSKYTQTSKHNSREMRRGHDSGSTAAPLYWCSSLTLQSKTKHYSHLHLRAQCEHSTLIKAVWELQHEATAMWPLLCSCTGRTLLAEVTLSGHEPDATQNLCTQLMLLLFYHEYPALCCAAEWKSLLLKHQVWKKLCLIFHPWLCTSDLKSQEITMSAVSDLFTLDLKLKIRHFLPPFGHIHCITQ